MAATSAFGSQRVRRRSSLDTSRSDLYDGWQVIVPPDQVEALYDADETATALEEAKQHLDAATSTEGSPAITPPVSQESPRPESRIGTTDKFALAFDIDGVLVKGGEALPASIQAMRYINGDNPFGVKVYVHSFFLDRTMKSDIR